MTITLKVPSIACEGCANTITKAINNQQPAEQPTSQAQQPQALENRPSPFQPAQKMGKLQGLTESLLALFTLGTIADLAPLIGVNRRWLKRGLRKLPKSQLVGIQSLMQIAGISEEQKQLQPDDIGFKLGPRINAIGRIGDPQIVIELLTTDDAGIALERAMQC